MKYAISILVLSLCHSFFAQEEEDQTAMNLGAQKTFYELDSTMELFFQNVLNEYAYDPEFVHKLEISQNAWLDWRNVEVEAYYNTSETNGSMFYYCYYNHLSRLTRERLDDLKRNLVKTNNEDGCAH